MMSAMIDAWHKVRALSAGDRFLVAEAVVLLSFVLIVGSIFPFRTLRRLLNHYGGTERKSTGRSSSEEIRRIAWAIAAAARRLPARTTCLVEALAADAMFRRRGCACELRFGVRPPVSAHGPLAAHAWIEHDGIVVLGQVANLSDSAVLSAPVRS
jgi:Transglutaminase-like superfamily